jgi:hypothetical protein
MSDPVVPAAAGPAPAPKKRSTGKILLIVGIVVVALCAVGGFAAYKLLGAAVDVAYAEGNCIDVNPTSTTAVTVTPKVVDCSDPKAAAKILDAVDGKTFADGEEVCGALPDAVSYIEITNLDGSKKLLCLGDA